jgi:hypothetical protein
MLNRIANESILSVMLNRIANESILLLMLKTILILKEM